MSERLRFVARLLEGEKRAPLCREFNISRKTGYKIPADTKRRRIEGLTDLSWRPSGHLSRGFTFAFRKQNIPAFQALL